LFDLLAFYRIMLYSKKHRNEKKQSALPPFNSLMFTYYSKAFSFETEIWGWWSMANSL